MFNKKNKFGDKIHPSGRPMVNRGKEFLGYEEEEDGEGEHKDTLELEKKAFEVSSNILIVEQSLKEFVESFTSGKSYEVICMNRQEVTIEMVELSGGTFEEFDPEDLDDDIYKPDYVISETFRNEEDLELLKECVAIVWARKDEYGDYKGVPIKEKN